MAIVGDEDPLLHSSPDLLDLLDRSSFFNLTAGSIKLLEFGGFRLDQTVQFEEDFPIPKAIFSNGDLVDGQLEVFIYFIG